jgi:hypothetical protein
VHARLCTSVQANVERKMTREELIQAIRLDIAVSWRHLRL